ncbi:Flavin-dependent oxidoreductase, luciferase family (includes alkanesulfonate monooxygenase SsuD and methylene tetrahydromethanopterin reductase) [Streptoalloteichus tenebrarius]|uniref:Flavin-dependent oxidoreductase, luciferase family (Includes alkanesulfonate monooxygenase SsuD and methylene tetrahydromethanopterin reductase) n=1 Tax=Streptoalloteichus tenebrarius (strain ATCC 17920 / DSM 40477 / JCM 4838 / CBS 697.72 / NBRC 16177 / NCIMB 11028 / NRRL B-12390 / A12253. 1 / ISP 5477) TaxID=1933 RepID=A0ABT1HXL7_STRSD|nr:LLM class flavin-dependent oxidoreductase [Streptoalloteichus tenebrarius]MCP2260267.1 Flavin-dependent oxidoreductase, luciferase family (includes alkanesulfonate monooxygenase SsuD and methylene tetrahydromethanopterin reductase) [Streptoalloteichus tenebrarius]BFF03017.1 LLM class F420-dependent oxidoreductase [Streptoalloteichus tenebrarius]
MSVPRIGVHLPVFGKERGGAYGQIAEAARHAEAVGLDAVWSGDQLITGFGGPALHSGIALATAAAVTERVGIGFGVLILPLRPVAWVAKQVATLQYLSGDRLSLGVGSGGTPHGAASWQAVGVPQEERGPRTDAALAVLPGLIAGEPTRLPQEPGEPVVTLAPGATVPPILIGGNSGVAQRRVLEHGDGWFPSSLPPETLGAEVARLRERAAERGRPAPRVVLGVMAALGEADADRAVASLANVYRISHEQAASILLTGDARAVADRFAAYAEAGADEIVVSFHAGAWHPQYDVLGEARSLLR